MLCCAQSRCGAAPSPPRPPWRPESAPSSRKYCPPLSSNRGPFGSVLGVVSQHQRNNCEQIGFCTNGWWPRCSTGTSYLFEAECAWSELWLLNLSFEVRFVTVSLTILSGLLTFSSQHLVLCLANFSVKLQWTSLKERRDMNTIMILWIFLATTRLISCNEISC